MANFGMSMLWFWVCYIIVTCVGILHRDFLKKLFEAMYDELPEPKKRK